MLTNWIGLPVKRCRVSHWTNSPKPSNKKMAVIRAVRTVKSRFRPVISKGVIALFSAVHWRYVPTETSGKSGKRAVKSRFYRLFLFLDFRYFPFNSAHYRRENWREIFSHWRETIFWVAGNFLSHRSLEILFTDLQVMGVGYFRTMADPLRFQKRPVLGVNLR